MANILMSGLIVILASVWVANAQQGFRGIAPMVTTKVEVEKKLGKPDKYGDYKVEEGRVHIDYYDQKCETKADCFCSAPVGTVRSIGVELSYDLYLKDLKLDPLEFKETHNSHIDVYAYSSSRIGMVYEVQDGRVTHIRFHESEEACNKLKPKEIPGTK